MHDKIIQQGLVVQQEPSKCLMIRLHNEGYGFGFTVQETGEKSITIRTILPEGVTSKVNEHALVYNNYSNDIIINHAYLY